MEKIEIAQILRPQGVHGDVKIALFADKDFSFENIKTVTIDDKDYKLEKVYLVGGGYAIKLENVDSRNLAETYRNKYIKVDKSCINIKPGEFFMADIIGKNAVVESKTIGKVVDIQNFGSADVFYISGQKNILVSHKQGLIEKLDDKNVVFNAKIFAEVSVYED